jgi:hypothetical protein
VQIAYRPSADVATSNTAVTRDIAAEALQPADSAPGLATHENSSQASLKQLRIEGGNFVFEE